MNTKVTYCDLAPNLRISSVLTGLWQIADMERENRQLDQVAAASAMKKYVDAGFTTFDMADHYGSAEEIAGIYTQKIAKEQSAQILTKWVPTPGKSSKEIVRQAIERSMQRLKTETIDLLQYHAWNYADPSYFDDLFWLQELQEEGWIRHLGVTNFDTAHLNLLVQSGIKVVSNQVCFSLLDQRAAKGMTALCQKSGIKILAFGTLAGGFLTERWLDQAEPQMDQLTTWSQMKYKRFIDIAGGWAVFQKVLKTIQQVATRHGVSMANIASKYVLDHPAVGGVIIGARLSKSEHIQENLRLFTFSLDEQSREEIAASLSLLHPIPGDCGDEYRKPPFLTASGDLSHHLDSFPPPYTRQEKNGRIKVFSGTVWEDLAGFSRAVKQGNRIYVSGTTATHGQKVIGGNDPAAQTHFAIDKIEGALQSLGSCLEDVVRTRVFIRHSKDWEPVSRVHGQRFGHIQPANTLVSAELIGDAYLVEIEAEAVLR